MPPVLIVEKVLSGDIKQRPRPRTWLLPSVLSGYLLSKRVYFTATWERTERIVRIPPLLFKLFISAQKYQNLQTIAEFYY